MITIILGTICIIGMIVCLLILVKCTIELGKIPEEVMKQIKVIHIR